MKIGVLGDGAIGSGDRRPPRRWWSRRRARIAMRALGGIVAELQEQWGTGSRGSPGRTPTPPWPRWSCFHLRSHHRRRPRSDLDGRIVICVANGSPGGAPVLTRAPAGRLDHRRSAAGARRGRRCVPARARRVVARPRRHPRMRRAGGGGDDDARSTVLEPSTRSAACGSARAAVNGKASRRSPRRAHGEPAPQGRVSPSSRRIGERR